MGNWGKWWSSRGADTIVKCEFCGCKVPKHKAVEINVGARLDRDVYEMAEYVSVGHKKAYACISCAKHRHIVKDGIHTTEKDKRMRKKAKEKREMDKVMAKVKELERTDKAKPKPQGQKPAESEPKTEETKKE